MSYHNHDYSEQNGQPIKREDKVTPEINNDFRMLEILVDYDIKERAEKFLIHVLTKTPEENRIKILTNWINSMIGSAILHYERKYVRKESVTAFNQQL